MPSNRLLDILKIPYISTDVQEKRKLANSCWCTGKQENCILFLLTYYNKFQSVLNTDKIDSIFLSIYNILTIAADDSTPSILPEIAGLSTPTGDTWRGLRATPFRKLKNCHISHPGIVGSAFSLFSANSLRGSFSRDWSSSHLQHLLPDFRRHVPWYPAGARTRLAQGIN